MNQADSFQPPIQASLDSSQHSLWAWCTWLGATTAGDQSQACGDD